MSLVLAEAVGLPTPLALTDPIELTEPADPVAAAFASVAAAYDPETQLVEAESAPFIVAFATNCVGICGTGKLKSSDYDVVSDD